MPVTVIRVDKHHSGASHGGRHPGRAGPGDRLLRRPFAPVTRRPGLRDSEALRFTDSLLTSHHWRWFVGKPAPPGLAPGPCHVTGPDAGRRLANLKPMPPPRHGGCQPEQCPAGTVIAERPRPGQRGQSTSTPAAAAGIFDSGMLAHQHDRLARAAALASRSSSILEGPASHMQPRRALRAGKESSSPGCNKTIVQLGF